MEPLHTVLVTGANGFVGRALCKKMVDDGLKVRGTVRSAEQAPGLLDGIEAVQIGSIGPDTDCSDVLSGVDTVIHLAARVHVIKDISSDPLSEFRQVNVLGTERLARCAVAAGVRRFIFISSIKVNGECTELRAEGLERKSASKRLKFSEDDVHAPEDPYGVSKSEAEQALQQISTETGLDVVIIRPPLVYGPRVKANFLKLLKLIHRGFPLPLSSLQNKRSMIYLGNLVDAIITCIEHQKVAGETFLVSDGEDVSTPDLIRMIAEAMNKNQTTYSHLRGGTTQSTLFPPARWKYMAIGKRPRLLPFPSPLLNLLGKVTGKSSEIERLTGSLQVDSSKIRNLLDWKPPFTMKEGIQETVNWYMNKK